MPARYDRERNQRGLKGSEGIDVVLLTLPRKVFNRSEVAEMVNGPRRFSVDPHTVGYHLDRLVKLGMFERPKKGFYRRK